MSTNNSSFQVKLGESLLLLNRQADHLLNALPQLLHVLNPGDHPFIEDLSSAETPASLARFHMSAPRLLSDSQYQPLAKHLAKKFPECLPDKSSAYQTFISERDKNIADLGPFYEIFIDVQHFSQTAQSILLGSEILFGLSMENGRLVFDVLLNVLHKFVQIHLMMSRCPSQRKTIISGFNLLALSKNGLADPKFESLCQYFQQCDKPWQTMAETFQPVAPFFCSLFKEVAVGFSAYTAFTAENIRKDPFLNICFSTNPPPTLKSFDSKKMRVLLSNYYFPQLTSGYLLFANELMKDPQQADHWKVLLGQNVNFIVARDHLFQFDEECEQLIKVSPKNFNKMKTFSDAVASQLPKSIQFHKERRDSLKLLLKQTRQILDEKPAILSAKMPTIEVLLKLAIDEIKWFFSHHEYTLQMKSSKSFSKLVSGQFTDPSILELLYWTWSLKDLIMQRIELIQKSTARLMAVEIYPLLESSSKQIMNQAAMYGPQVTECIQTVLQDVQTASPESSFQPLRVNFSRLLVRFNCNTGGKNIDEHVKEFLSVLDLCCTHSRYVDFLERLCTELSIGFLFDFRYILTNFYSQILKDNHSLIPCTSVIPHIAAEFNVVATPFFIDDLKRVQEIGCTFTNQYYTSIANTAAELVHVIAQGHLRMSMQALLDLGFDKKLDRKSKRNLLEKSTNSLVKDSAETESALEPKFIALSDCVFALGNDPVLVGTTEFLPHVYLRDKIGQRFKSHIEGLILPETSVTSEDQLANIKKPSQYLTDLQSYMNTLAFVDSSLSLGLQEIMISIYIDYIEAIASRKDKSGSEGTSALKALNIRSKKIGISGSNMALLPSYVDVYSELMRDRNLPVSGFVYSVYKSNFSLANGAPSNFQIFTEYSELLALCQFLGPVGVAALNERLAVTIATIAKDIKEHLIANQDTLVSMVSSWTNETQFDEQIRKLKDLEDFFQNLIHIGMIDGFKNILIRAQQEVMHRNIPILAESIQDARKGLHLPTNPTSPFENLMCFVGNGGVLDPVLKQAMQGVSKSPASDLRLYSLLPYALAAALRVMVTFEQSAFSISHDAPLNNAHCLISAASILISVLVPQVAPSNEKILQEIRDDTIRVTSTVLLRIRTGSSAIPTTVKSLLCLIGQFAQYCYDMSPSDVEKYLPYSIVRSSYTDFLRLQSGINEHRPMFADRNEEDL